MPELILSDITIMGEGYCVIGLECTSDGWYRSVRPMPRRGFAWREPFPYRRGDVVMVRWVQTASSPPHFEDRQTTFDSPTGRHLAEVALVKCLERAEIADDLSGLFGCELQTDSPAGNAWVSPDLACRSICGCHYNNIRFRIYVGPTGTRVRARLTLPSGEVLYSLPVVDHEWGRFMNTELERNPNATTRSHGETFLNGLVRGNILESQSSFARIGLARARSGEDKCWLMLDSLFPQPVDSWLDAR